MGSQVRFIAESPGATCFGAFEGSLPCVAPRVDLKESWPGKLCLTTWESTNIWLLPGMSHNMGSKMAFSFEPFIAVRAPERPLVGVHPHMDLQAVGVLESLSTALELALELRGRSIPRGLFKVRLVDWNYFHLGTRHGWVHKAVSMWDRCWVVVINWGVVVNCGIDGKHEMMEINNKS